jgi:four helix bundle protein
MTGVMLDRNAELIPPGDWTFYSSTLSGTSSHTSSRRSLAADRWKEGNVFSHEKLNVYQKALTCVAGLARHTHSWDKRHAVVDHLLRASESIVLNLVEGARLRGAANRQHFTEYAMGSALECAACLDIAVLKEFLPQAPATAEKRALCEVVKMLAGLRRSWAEDELREDPPVYRASEKWLFAHERLEVYQVGLQFVGWFQAQPAGAALSSRLFRQLDKLGTSVVLNIAEGNGRYLEGDQRKFLDIGGASAAKAAAYLDLCCRSGELEQSHRDCGTELLGRVALMLRALTLC